MWHRILSRAAVAILAAGLSLGTANSAAAAPPHGGGHGGGHAGSYHGGGFYGGHVGAYHGGYAGGYRHVSPSYYHGGYGYRNYYNGGYGYRGYGYRGYGYGYPGFALGLNLGTLGYGYGYPAYYGDYGYPATYADSTYYTPSYSAPATSYYPPTEPAPAPASTSARITIEVPADARLWIDGQLSNQTGTVRNFETPVGLDPGRTYSYKLVAEWVENGQKVLRERIVQFQAGNQLVVNMMAG